MRIALITNDDFSMWHFWRGLIRALKARSVDVIVVTPEGPFVSALLGIGARHRAIILKRFMSPWSDIWFCFCLYRLFKAEHVDLVCNITVKPNVYGAIVGKLAGVQRIVGMIEGLGYGFNEGRAWQGKARVGVVKMLYWLAGLLSDRIGFANPDDYATFLSLGLIPKRKAVVFRSMIGVNTQEFCPSSTKNVCDHNTGESRPLSIVMVVARVVLSKGVHEFVQASQIAKGWSRKVEFTLVGPLDPDAEDAIDERYLRQMLSETFRWVGFTNDIRSVWNSADIAVLPSYYREGVPRSLLEAMAMGKPIVTTDNVGCREVVEEEQNGFLVQPRDSAGLAAATEKLVSNDERRRVFGERSRQKAMAEFDEVPIIKRIMEELFHIHIET